MTEPGTSKKPRSRSKYGCYTCRRSRVKCDEGWPICERCKRLSLKCEQPSARTVPTLGERRRGFGPLKSRPPESWSPATILPDTSSPSVAEASQADTPENEDTMDFYHAMDGNWSTTYPSPGADYSSSLTSLLPLDAIGIMELNADWLLPYPQSVEMPLTNVGHQLKTLSLATPTPLNSITIRGILLSDVEKQALDYFRTSFSLSQTTRDPQWSTTTLLLEHKISSPMLLHLVLAVSLYDLEARREIHDHGDNIAQRHYEEGARELAEALQSEQATDHIAVLGSIYCVYAYMSRQACVSSSKVDRLSFTAMDYIKRKGLDVLFRVPHATSSASQLPVVNRIKAENSLIARLIMWLIKIDAQCCFLGCNPSILKYFEAHSDALDATQATSRLALQLNWGKDYPISQSIRDIESNMSMDFMADLLVMSYRISQYDHIRGGSEGRGHVAELQNSMDRLEVKYGAVFYYGSSEMTLQPAMKLNCATSATMFYATKIYLLCCGSSPFGAQDSSEAAHALGQLLLFAKHVCVGGASQPVYEFQWSLFIACLESNDTIHQEWLASKICDARFRGVLERVFVTKRGAGGEISLDSIKELLGARL